MDYCNKAMEFKYQENCENVDWEEIPLLLSQVGMSSTTTDRHRLSFENSYAVVFVFDQEELIACGRMISDGVRQAAIYDVAVKSDYQGQNIGTEIMKRLLLKASDCNVILYASPGKEDFYRKLNFKKMKTGMALFANAERMENSEFVEN